MDVVYDGLNYDIAIENMEELETLKSSFLEGEIFYHNWQRPTEINRATGKKLVLVVDNKIREGMSDDYNPSSTIDWKNLRKVILKISREDYARIFFGGRTASEIPMTRNNFNIHDWSGIGTSLNYNLSNEDVSKLFLP